MNYHRSFFAILVAINLLAGCAGVNPNVGMRTADDALSSGNCARALESIERGTEKRWPWAQTRMGLLYFLGQCKPRDYSEARLWFLRAATYESKTSWEKGSDFATGPVGFHNARASAANASFMLMEIYAKGLGVEKDLVEAWLWTNSVVHRFDEGESGRTNAERARRDIEILMTPEQIARARDRANSWKPSPPIPN